MPDAQEKMADFDPQTIRKDFPILAREVHGKPLVYLDNAASAQKPVQVTGRMQRVFDSEYSNVHRGLHYLSCLLYTSPSPRDRSLSRMPSSA